MTESAEPAEPAEPDWHPIADQLARALRHLPCSCAYKRVNGIPLWVNGQRVLEKACSRCAALERYDEAGAT